MRAVRFDRYGDRDVLYIAEVEVPEPLPPVRSWSRCARRGSIPARRRFALVRSMRCSRRRFPPDEGSDLAGTVSSLGEGVSGFAVGDEVIGWSWRRSSHAEYVAVPVDQLIAKPAGAELGGRRRALRRRLHRLCRVRAVGAGQGDTVAVSAAAGGVGTVCVQLLRSRGATVLGIASEPNHDWLRAHGSYPCIRRRARRSVAGSCAERHRCLHRSLRAGYLELAVELGVARERINTIVSRDKANELGRSRGKRQRLDGQVLAEMVALVASSQIEVPIAATYPLEQVRDAFAELEERHTRGKIVLIP